jgi:HSP20 family protein
MTDRRYPDEMDRMFDEMNRAFDRMRRSMRGWDYDWSGSPFEGRMPLEGRMPRFGAMADTTVSVEAIDEGYVVLADIPGFEREELDVRFDEGVLTVTGTHEVDDEYSHRSRHVHEEVRVPGEIIVDEISATYRNGVLEIHLPTEQPVTEEHEDDEGHRIDID